MPRDGDREDHDHLPHSGMLDLPSGQSEAAEDFGVSLQPEDTSMLDEVMSYLVQGWFGWRVHLLVGLAMLVFLGLLVLGILLTTPAHPTDTAVMQASLVYLAFALVAILYGAVVGLDALPTWRERRAEGRRIYGRLIRGME